MTTSFLRGFIYLINCGLHGVVPEYHNDYDYEKLFAISRSQSLIALTGYAVEKQLKLKEINPELYKKWTEEKDKAIRKILLLTFEREEICKQFAEQGIWYLPLKGSVLKDLYPALGMRQMADQDILVDESKRDAIRKIFECRSYETIAYGLSNHDVYEKKPVYNFEIHVSLFGSAHRNLWYEYYNTINDKLITVKDQPYERAFTNEDFYVYMILHAYKHYYLSGTGIRSLIDCYIYHSKYDSTLDWDYIEKELEKLEVLSFERKFRSLATKVFSETKEDIIEKLSQSDLELLLYMIGSGTYGTMDNRVDNELDRLIIDSEIDMAEAKHRYLLKRLFPDKEWLKQNKPFVYKTKVLIPFFYVFRIVRGLCRRGKMIRREYKIVMQAKGKQECD